MAVSSTPKKTGGSGSLGGYSSAQIKDQMDKNSQAWHQTTDKAERDRLHQENVNLQGAMDKATGDVSHYNSSTGKWTTYDKGVGSGDWIGGDGPSYGAQGGGGSSGGGGYQQNQQKEQENLYAQLLEEQKRQQEYIRQQQEAAKRAAVEQAVGGLNAQKGTLEQSYQDLYRQLYLDRRKAEKGLPQQMAAMGYNGGLTESSALTLQTQYGDALRQGEQAKQGTMNSIDQAIQNARLSGDISIAEQAAQLAQQGFSTYADIVGAMQQQNNFDKQFGYQQFLDDRNFGYQAGRDQVADQRWNQQWEYGVGQDQYQNEREKALYLAGTGNFSALGSLWGMGEGDVQSLTSAYAQQMQTGQQEAARDLAAFYAQYGDFSKLREMGINVNLPSKSSGGGTGSSGRPRLSAAQAMDAWNNGVDTPEVRSAVSYYYGDIFGGGDVASGGGMGSAQVDMNSVLALGMGPLSADQLATMEARGTIQGYVENGKIRFRKMGSENSLFGNGLLGG